MVHWGDYQSANSFFFDTECYVCVTVQELEQSVEPI